MRPHAESEQSIVVISGDDPIHKTPFFYGYSQALDQAWRCEHDDADDADKRQYTDDIRVNPRGPMAPALAVWPDGTSHEMSELLSASVDSRKKSCAAAPAHGTIPVDFEHRFADGKTIIIKWRSEGPFRPPIMSMYLNGSQCCQVGISDEVPQQCATEILKLVAQRFIKGELKESELYQARDQEMKSRGLNPRRRVSNKPCANEATPQGSAQGLQDSDACLDKEDGELAEEGSHSASGDTDHDEQEPTATKRARISCKRKPASTGDDSERGEGAQPQASKECAFAPAPCEGFLESYDLF